MGTVFYYMDLSFQLFSDAIDETYAIVAWHMNDLRKYYDKKACLNFNHSEKMIDIFRFCIRRDKLLSKCLDKDFAGFDMAKENAMAVEQATSDIWFWKNYEWFSKGRSKDTGRVHGLGLFPHSMSFSL